MSVAVFVTLPEVARNVTAVDAVTVPALIDTVVLCAPAGTTT